MKKVFIKISALSIALVVATSCTKTGPAGPSGGTGPAGPSLTGNMQGTVFLYDASGAKQLPTGAVSLQGAAVVITNNSTGATTTEATTGAGSYSFGNLTTGTYSITVSLTGYGSVIAQGVQFVGGGTANRNFSLSVVPTTTVSSAAAVDTSFASVGGPTAPVENYVKVRGYVPVSSAGSTVIVYVSIPGMTSTSSTPGNFASYYTTTIAPGATSFKINIPTASLYDLGFVTGNTVYFAAYVVGGNTSASSYVDWTTGQTVFTALSSTAVNTSAAVQ